MTDHKQPAREPKTTYEKHVTSLPCGCERMTFDWACNIRDQLAPIGSHLNHFMARWGWHPAETRVDTDYVYPCNEHRRPTELGEKAEPNTAVGYAKYGNVTTTVYPTLRDAICKLCGKTGGEHVGVDGCPSERKGFEFL